MGVFAWAIAILAGMVGLARYQMTPGALPVARHWPHSVRVTRDPSRPTLVMSLHPQCPCSRASVHELEVLMARSGGNLAVRVIFVQPHGAPADWLDTTLWRSAEAIPGVTVAADPNGTDARAFGATVSGQVNLYDSHGNFLFVGGITDGRGHEGDNAGVDAILALLREGKSPVTVTPVYGCPLGTDGVCKIGDR